MGPRRVDEGVIPMSENRNQPVRTMNEWHKRLDDFCTAFEIAAKIGGLVKTIPYAVWPERMPPEFRVEDFVQCVVDGYMVLAARRLLRHYNVVVEGYVQDSPVTINTLGLLQDYLVAKSPHIRAEVLARWGASHEAAKNKRFRARQTPSKRKASSPVRS